MEFKKTYKNVLDNPIKDHTFDTPVFGFKMNQADNPGTLLRRLNSIDSIKILSRLTRRVQKHRGASIACIDGDTSFLPLAEQLEEQIDKLFLLLIHQQNQQSVLPQRRIISANSDWQAIKSGWKKDDIIQNYEFHCHLVDVLSRLTRDSINESMMPPPDYPDAETLTINIRSVMMDVPENIELLAKLRGLITHTAASGQCNHDSQIRINFLQEKISRDYKRLYHALGKLKGPLANLQTLQSLPRQQSRLDLLLSMVQEGIIEPDVITADANKLFELATEIIDLYWLVFQQGLQIIEDEQFSWYLD